MKFNDVHILSVSTTAPEYTISQSQVRDFAAGLFRSEFQDELERLLPIFDNTAIHERHFSQPLEWFTHQHEFHESNELYQKIALELSVKAAEEAIAKAGIAKSEIAALVFVSTTGIATPSIDSKIIQTLGLSHHVNRLPVWGLGCAGGVAGLARSAEMAAVYPGRAVLFIAVELCSLTFQYNDHSKSNLVATSLFADGAAALVLRAKEGDNGIQILDSFSTLFDDSEDVMGWDIIPTGLKVRFSRDIPTIIREYLPGEIDNSCREWEIEKNELQHYVLHPGGAKVLEAYRECFDMKEEYLAYAREILRCFGNMSSPSVLFVLEEFLKKTPGSGDYGLMLALGPGFSAEQILFHW